MRALISVSDKTGIVELGRAFHEAGIELVSTGGTHQALEEAGLPVIGISEVTQFPEMLDGRVKTLHPMVHGGLLGRRDLESHREQMAAQQIQPIDFVVVNLYPFKQTVLQEDVAYADAIENIDIGGPSMLRSAAKNHVAVTVVVDPADYETVVAEIREGGTTFETRQRLAAKAFRHTAAYDALIADYFLTQTGEKFPDQLTITLEKVQDLRYGENPHQEAAFYKTPIYRGASLASAKQLHGKELSYNNIQDANAALEILDEFREAAAVVVKHMNPCGVAVGPTIGEAFRRAHAADPVSIFGGIVALNREVDLETAEQLSGIFLEIIIAPSFTEDAFALLSAKKNIRLLELDVKRVQAIRYTAVAGGMLVQDSDDETLDDAAARVVTDRKPTAAEWEDLKLAWRAVKHVKSNAIVLAKDEVTVGVGAGQMNRVGSANIAITQAGEKAVGASLASDAFFPMGDTVEAAAAAGITAIIQPGGSIRDQESIDACNKHGITMVFTNVRHFKH
ncbi:bifunctional phosphoribosylaminoimidazolecarboxamide formyltransferase/IMP cyclohydrolase [Exiguobacterium sp. TBG-PICH-001]|uniref:bifunctional phosphoribosylaminoimidazolecarboxamide formyltransferase/IMP cyclohydrolase n=1 Tax=Exiguobacterium abrahamii TaxID=2785532 RepID=UPI0018A7B7C8|nr:bifunctional phosphoribosylaminoimidazolecarboxamide formyltransferase/IMP cyclohydrolase [Exiguobacterium sp. TBG-PICH-001]MBF8154032.1 bifunctional phosphoribosylaminoimidazolecarboxamide formyltransferase/IMP cyclohydrolase [Exiguobacterium sp. TBG-PICH-001]